MHFVWPICILMPLFTLFTGILVYWHPPITQILFMVGCGFLKADMMKLRTDTPKVLQCGKIIQRRFSTNLSDFCFHELDLQALRRLLDMCLSYSRDGRSSFRNVNIYQSSFLNISAPNPQLRLLTCLIILCQWKLLPRCLCPLRIWWAPCPRSTNPSQNQSSTGEFLLVARSPWSTDCLQDKPAKWGLVERLLLLTQGGPQFRLLQHF